jgi:hypothetical protein
MAECKCAVTVCSAESGCGERDRGTFRRSPIMSLVNHLEELQRKHGDIEREIDEAMLHPSVDDLEIVSLKRRKLAIKDEIQKLKARPTQH